MSCGAAPKDSVSNGPSGPAALRSKLRLKVKLPLPCAQALVGVVTVSLFDKSVVPSVAPKPKH